MKQLFLSIIILCSLSLSAQRDTLTSELRTYATIDTLNLGARYKVTTTHWSQYLGNSVAIDTSDTSNLTDHLDAIITVMQSDSAILTSQVEYLYLQYQRANTMYQNAKRYLVKLWAIRPTDGH